MQQRRPVARKLPIKEDEWFKRYKYLSKDEPYHMLLESGRGGKYSIIGLRPFATIKGKNNQVEIIEHGQRSTIEGDPLVVLKEWMRKYKTEHVPSLPDFQGGAIGYISYDYVRQIEKLPTVAADDLLTPDICFFIFDDIFVYDHNENILWLMTIDNGDDEKTQKRLDHYERMWSVEISHELNFAYPTHANQHQNVSMSEEEFKEAVEKVKNYIAQGDVFQINLSVRQSKSITKHPIDIYEQLRELNPSPYMAYLEMGDVQIVSGSPELLIKKDGEEVSTRPIAGTRSRGTTHEEDVKLANELIQNEKERAEHVMLVDLERNDLGRVCRYGTVEVDEFMIIEKYSHVMHIVSNVKGKLGENKNAYDLIRAVFPGGTITGAPKVRTMEIIEELEPVRRGMYTGSIGWIGFSDNLELNIVIRTMVVKDGIAHIQAGAGIVIDSNPKYEYKESLKKAKALWKAIELCEAKEVNSFE
ncbi:anthranilate synthase component I [Cytobacillus sp. Hm23]